MASAAIRKVNFNSNKVIAGKISINLNKGLDFSQFRLYEKLTRLPWFDSLLHG